MQGCRKLSKIGGASSKGLTVLPKIPASLKCALVLILKQFDVNYLTLDPSHV